MHFSQMIFATAPDYLAAKALRETCLVVNTASIVCEISDKKFCLPNCRDDFVVDTIIVFRSINSERFISGCAHAGFYSIDEEFIKLRSKGHGDEHFCALRLCMP